MAKPDPALLDPARYPFACELGTRFGDMDLNRHLNNVALASLIEETRVRFNSQSGLAETIAGYGVVVGSMSIEYLAQAFYPQPVRGRAAVEALGRSSWTLVQLLIQDERIVVFARSVLVCIRDGASAPLPDAVRAGYESLRLR